MYELDLTQCKEKFKHYEENSYDLEQGIVDSQVCAENRISKSDTCQGNNSKFERHYKIIIYI